MSILHSGGVDMSFKVSWKLHAVCFIIAFLFCLIEQENIYNLFANMLFHNNMMSITGTEFIKLNISIIIIFSIVACIHELIHGFVYRIFGGKVRYGFKVLYAYVQEVSGNPLHRTKFLLVLLAPVTIISVASIFISGNIGTIIFILNFLGSMGDLLMAFYLCKTSENSYIIDKEYGFDVVEKIGNSYK
ncbi:DUF3267 domain-containing protein [Clostridium chromiireducens]|uniref:DUF3267 domain-containing protein n=2 Tax=Clostridium chromiireducens TaxID=225345 RepID=A0A399ISW0_9CLOT|nr:DUF3267 domain-containing protein [Clostridium chromiireducens]